jgi:bacteriorhodopsin
VPFVGNRGLSGGQVLSTFQWELVLFALIAAGLALLASFIYALTTKAEVSKKYRNSTIVNAIISLVATVSYVILVAFWIAGYHYNGHEFVPATTHFFATSLRYPDWTITVPLLMVEFLAVAGLTGKKQQRLRGPMMGTAAAMIITGFVGQALNEDATSNLAAFAIWGGVSTVFFLALYPMFASALRASKAELGAESYSNLVGAAGLLLVTWLVYPACYVVFGFTRTDTTWAIVVQLAFCAADVTAKAGFGAWIHKVAKLRTAEDVARGELSVSDIFPQEVYVDQVLLSRPAVDVRDGQSVSAAGTGR